MTQKVYFHAPKFILYPGMHLRLEMELYGPDVAGKYEYKEIDGINSLQSRLWSLIFVGSNDYVNYSSFGLNIIYFFTSWNFLNFKKAAFQLIDSEVWPTAYSVILIYLCNIFFCQTIKRFFPQYIKTYESFFIIHHISL